MFKGQNKELFRKSQTLALFSLLLLQAGLPQYCLKNNEKEGHNRNYLTIIIEGLTKSPS